MNRRTDNKAANGRSGGRVKFRYSDADRYMDFEMDGATDALADGLRSLANALSQTSAAPRPVRTLNPVRSTSAAAEPASPQEELPFSNAADPGESTEAEVPREATEGPIADVDRARRRYAPRTPNILSDVDLASGQMPLKTFAEQKSPSETLDRYAVIAAWFKAHRNLDEVTADHMYTCFKFLGWPSPDDVGQPLRDLKSKKRWFDKGTGKGGYKINIIGMNAVDKMNDAK